MKSLTQYINEAKGHKVSDSSLQQAYDLMFTSEAMLLLNHLQDRWEDEYKYENESDYTNKIEKFFKNNGVTNKFVTKKELPKNYQCDEETLQFGFVGTTKVMVVDGIGFKPYFLNESDGDKISKLLGKSTSSSEPIIPNPSKYKKNFGAPVDLGDGHKCKIGDIVIKYDTFEGGYISIGQIVQYEKTEKGNDYLILLADDDISTVEEWNDAIKDNDTFIMVGHDIEKDKYQKYDAKLLAKYQDMLKDSRKNYKYRY